MLDNWNIITEASQVQEIIAASKQQLQLVYKHSFTCGICHMAKDEIEEEYDAISAKADMHFVDVKKSRPVSNTLAEKTGVRHESPQVLIIDQASLLDLPFIPGLFRDGALDLLPLFARQRWKRQGFKVLLVLATEYGLTQCASSSA